MTATTTLASGPATLPAPASQRSATKQIRRTGVLAGIAAAVATSTTAAVASALDVSLKVGGEAIPVVGFAQLTFVAAIIGTVMAVVTLSARPSEFAMTPNIRVCTASESQARRANMPLSRAASGGPPT